MSDLDTRRVKDLFARLFVLGIQNKVNLYAFTKLLEKSDFAKKIEKGQYDDYFNKSIQQIFYDITNYYIDADDSYGIYNDAYWCGYSYFELQQKTKKAFAFIFLKFPFKKMIDIYSIYHEMDFSALEECFYKLDKEKTILRLLCEENNCSIPKLGKELGISTATLSKYNASDEALYKGSFQVIYRLASYFDVPVSLFYKQGE